MGREAKEGCNFRATHRQRHKIDTREAAVRMKSQTKWFSISAFRCVFVFLTHLRIHARIHVRLFWFDVYGLLVFKCERQTIIQPAIRSMLIYIPGIYAILAAIPFRDFGCFFALLLFHADCLRLHSACGLLGLADKYTRVCMYADVRFSSSLLSPQRRCRGRGDERGKRRKERNERFAKSKKFEYMSANEYFYRTQTCLFGCNLYACNQRHRTLCIFSFARPISARFRRLLRAYLDAHSSMFSIGHSTARLSILLLKSCSAVSPVYAFLPFSFHS